MGQKHKFRCKDGKHQFLCGETVVIEIPQPMCVGSFIHTFCPGCGANINTPCCMRATDVDFDINEKKDAR